VPGPSGIREFVRDLTEMLKRTGVDCVSPPTIFLERGYGKQCFFIVFFFISFSRDERASLSLSRARPLAVDSPTHNRLPPPPPG